MAAYPNCTEIAGALTLGQGDINDISGLSAITSITQELGIAYNDLTSLDGLDNLVSASGIYLVSLPLANIDALSQLTSLDEFIIFFCPNLTSLAGLENVTSFGNFQVGGMNALASLDGLNEAATFDNFLLIADNPLLSACDAPAICNHLDAGGSAEISGNAAGCSSIAEVEAACFPCDIAIDNIAPAAESCPGANDGGITVTASCTTCSGVEYSIDGVNFQAGNTFSGLAPGAYTVTARDAGDASCEATDNTTVNGGPTTDSDGDGTEDCNDSCPNDPAKVDPGDCGCGNPEPGASCDDGNANTINDQVQADCSCQGIQLCPAGSIQLSTGNSDFPAGQMTQWTVPPGVTEVTILTRGGDGGSNPSGIATGGGGAVAAATVSVNPGDVLNIVVAGTAGFQAGGGGTGVYNLTTNEVLIVGGGGGGASGSSANGQGGRATEEGGTINTQFGGAGGTNGSGGGTGSSSGGGGGAFSDGATASGTNAGGGGQGVPAGGSGGVNPDRSDSNGAYGFGGGGAGGTSLGTGLAGAGGGGYSGGGGNFANGGGGGSFVAPSGTNVTIIAGADGGGMGNPGAVTLCYTPPACDIAIDNITPADEGCPGANDGSITVSASCTTCSSIEYSIDGVNFQASATFTGVAAGFYVVTARDAADHSCTTTGGVGVDSNNTDSDHDGIPDCLDNCPTVNNHGQQDTDGDGIGDACDGCPNDANKTEPGICGCGVADTDTDGDGTADCNDGCPSDPDKTAPGICGCGVADDDSDGDGTADCNDGCPNDEFKTDPGACGCGVADTDTDNDGLADCIDACPNDPDNDADGDGVCGDVDNCPATANAGQEDSDCDGVGDACDLCDGGDDSVDNNNDGLPDCAYPPAYADIVSAWKCGNGNNQKVEVCHKGKKTNCISINALSAHIAHGDYLGPCGSANCNGSARVAPGGIVAAQNGEALQLEAMPNPFSEQVSFRYYLPADGRVQLSLYSIHGQQVAILADGQQAAGPQQLEWTGGNELPAGVYFARLQTESGVRTLQVVLAK